MVLIFIVTCLVITIFVSFWKHRGWVRKAKGFPGPEGLPILGNAVEISSPKDILSKLMAYKRKYGKVFRIQVGPQLMIFVSDQKLIHHFLSNPRNNQKGQFYKFLKNWLGNGILVAEGETWKKQKKFLNPAFHVKVLEGFLSSFAEGGDRLVQLLQNDVGRESVDIWDKLYRSNFGIFTETIMGLPAHAKLEEAEQYFKAVEVMCELLMSNTFSMKAHIPWLHKFTENYIREKQALEVINGVVKSQIRRARQKLEIGKSNEPEQESHNGQNAKRKVSMLDLLLESDIDGRPLTDQEVLEQMNTFMVAGHDTTSTTIYFALYVLANHPEIKKKVTDELECLPELDYENPQDLQKLKYLEMVIKETIRKYTIIPFFGRSLGESETIDGYNFPKGATFIAFLYGMHLDEDYFPNPEVFDPERFSSEISPKAFCAFSLGYRPCIGQRFAMLMLKSILAKLLNNFDVLPAVPHLEPQLITTSVLKAANGLRIQLREKNL